MGKAPQKTASGTILLEDLPFRMDRGIGSRASIGMIVLATDYTIEYEWRKLFADIDGVALYHTRIFNDNCITPDTLRAMLPRISDCASVITPDTPLDIIAYGCTSASVTLGEDAVFDAIHQARPECISTTPITAAFAAFDAFNAKRIGVLTPYESDVNQIIADYIRVRGFHVPVFGSFNERLDTKVSRITPDSIEGGIREILKHADVDMVFVSCTSVRLLDACASLEQNIGIPITSSNHAMAWHALRLAGIEDDLSDYGSLYARQIQTEAPVRHRHSD